MTKGTVEHISTCHPIVIEKFVQLRSRCQEVTAFNATYELICTCGWRSPKDQQIVFDTGKSDAKPGYSYHEYWLAFDCAPMGRSSKQVFWNDDQAWNVISNCSNGLGLEWGGSWGKKGIVDKPHFHLGVAPIEDLRNQWKFSNITKSEEERVRLFHDWATAKYLASIA